MKVTMKTEGFAELEKKLNRLPAAASKKVMRSALMLALTPIVKAAKAMAPIDRIKNNIRKKSAITKANDFKAEAGVIIRTKGNINDPRNGWMWHFFEWGTKARRHNKGSKRFTGAIRQQSYLRPAFDQKKEDALARFKMILAQRIDREAKK
jgi:HK97 gp10 family phage protein